MADLAFDAVVVGGGNKGLVTALYLAAFGGMSVGIFEGRHELGGGWASDDAPAPGFIGDSHCANTNSRYFLPLLEDFPDFSEKSGGFVEMPVARSVILEEDHSCITIYGKSVDPDGTKTAAQIARFSEKDAEIWMKLYHNYWKPGGLHDASIRDENNLALSPNERSWVEKQLDEFIAEPGCPIDHRWTRLSMIQACRELWESVEMRVFLAWSTGRSGAPADVDGSAGPILDLPEEASHLVAVGGTHSVAHAVIRMILERGGKFYSRKWVNKILIENGRATGVRLEDGSEVKARKVVVTDVSPYQLCFEMVGKEYFSPEIMRKIACLKNDSSCITWYTWAIHNPVNWKASKFNPDINKAGWIVLGWRDDEYTSREHHMCQLGITPKERQVCIWGTPTLIDPSRAPVGKHLICTEQMMPPANRWTERQWMEFKKTNAEQTMAIFERYTTNMNWDNVIGYNPITPYDIANRSPNFAPEGGFAVINNTPTLVGKFRPIQEFARHRCGIAGLYPTGSAWPPKGGGHSCQGYNCYKAIAEDLHLDKPWEKKGRPW
jgi:phytoene dehydrogenase-like protein